MKCEKCHFFDANIRHIGTSTGKKSLVHNFSRHQYSSRPKIAEKTPRIFWGNTEEGCQLRRNKSLVLGFSLK